MHQISLYFQFKPIFSVFLQFILISLPKTKLHCHLVHFPYLGCKYTNFNLHFFFVFAIYNEVEQNDETRSIIFYFCLFVWLLIHIFLLLLVIAKVRNACLAAVETYDTTTTSIKAINAAELKFQDIIISPSIDVACRKIENFCWKKSIGFNIAFNDYKSLVSCKVDKHDER